MIPALKGKLDGYAMRVPTPDVSVVDLESGKEVARVKAGTSPWAGWPRQPWTLGSRLGT